MFTKHKDNYCTILLYFLLFRVKVLTFFMFNIWICQTKSLHFYDEIYCRRNGSAAFSYNLLATLSSLPFFRCTSYLQFFSEKNNDWLSKWKGGVTFSSAYFAFDFMFPLWFCFCMYVELILLYIYVLKYIFFCQLNWLDFTSFCKI